MSQACHQLDEGSAKKEIDIYYIFDIFVKIIYITNTKLFF